jgi:hypothetical protein
MAVAATITIDVMFSSPTWTDVTADVSMAQGVRWRGGMSDGGPLDRVATTGTLEFALRNDAGNSGSLQGYYSPLHTNCRSGWAFGVPVRVLGHYSGNDYPLWQGRVRTIRPDPGVNRSNLVFVTAQDCMGDLVDHVVREISPQVDKTEVEILEAILAALPTDAQPYATNLDTALDAYPYALDNASDGVSAMALASAVVASAQGYLYPRKATGGIQYTNRQTWTAITTGTVINDSAGSVLSLDDPLSVPSSRDEVFNLIRCHVNPRRVDTTSATILWRADSIIVVAPSQTVTIWATYTDPDNANQLIGAADVQIAPVAYTDYMANAAPSGLSTDTTGDVDVAVTGFASTAKVEITNNNASTVYIVNASGEPFLYVKGRGVYSYATITAESYTAAAYSDKTLDVDLPYQDDVNVAQGAADYLKELWSSLDGRINHIGIEPQNSDTAMVLMMSKDIGHRVTVSETMTGLSSVDAIIVGMECGVSPSGLWTCRWTMTPAIDWMFFTLDTSTLDGADELGYF